MAGLFGGDFTGAKKRKEQIDKTLQGGAAQPSIRAAQTPVTTPAVAKKKRPYVAPKVPFEIRPGADTARWLAKRKAEFDAQ